DELGVFLAQIGTLGFVLLFFCSIPQILLSGIAEVSPHAQADAQQDKEDQKQDQGSIGTGGVTFLDGFFQAGHGATSAKREMCAVSGTALFFQCKKVTDLVKQFDWVNHGS